MKKIIAMLLVLVMALSLVACGGGANEKVELNVIAAQYGQNTAEWWKGFEADFEAANNNIDHIFINDKVQAKLFNVIVDHDVVHISDHLPIYADIVLK